MRRYLQLGFVLCALFLGRTALADDAAMAEAQARFKEGLEYVDASKFEEARLKFLQAFAVLKAPAVLFNLASAEQKTNHDVEAVEHYRAFAKASVNDPRITDAMRDKAKQNIAELLKKVAQIEIDAPEGAKLMLDGKPLEETPRETIAVTEGKHTIEATWGGRVQSVSVEAKVGQVVKATISAGAPAIEPTAAAPTEERTTPGWAVPIGLGVLGVAGLVTGGVLASSSQSSKDDAEKLRADAPGLCAAPTQACAAYDDKRSSAESQAVGAYFGYAAGGVLLAASIATFVMWPKASTTARAARLVPQLGPRGGGASLQVGF